MFEFKLTLAIASIAMAIFGSAFVQWLWDVTLPVGLVASLLGTGAMLGIVFTVIAFPPDQGK